MAQIKDKAKQIQKLKSMGQYGSSVPSSGKKEAFVNLQRQKFFGDRKDVPEERVIRRTRQEGGVDQFKQSLISSGRVLKDSKGNPVMNPNTGEPVYLTDVPGGRTVGDVSRDFAYRFGPTPREIAGDIGYGIKSIGSALGQKIGAGEFGVMGIAKALYEKFSNAVNVSKKAIGDQINKLSDIDLEILKNKDKYSYTSKKPNLVNIDQLEANAKLASDNRDYFGSYFKFGGPSMPGQVTIEEQVTTPVTAKTTPSFTSLPGSGYTPSPLNYNSMPGFTIQTDYESPEKKMQRLIEESNKVSKLETSSPLLADASQSDIDRINTMRDLKKMDSQSIYDMKDVFQLSPDLTLDEIQKIKEGTITQPTGQYAANGGMIEKRLGDIQKKTNNIYGTGILSVR